MIPDHLRRLALLEGVPASVAEVQQRFGISVLDIVSILVALGYHKAKAACTSDDPGIKAKGQRQMSKIALACTALSELYEDLGLVLEAAHADEAAGTCFAFAGDESREEKIAEQWCLRITTKRGFNEIVEAMISLEGDWWIIGCKYLLKLAKHTPGLTFEQRWALVNLMATKSHPDTLGRAIWAVDTAPCPDTEVALRHLRSLDRADLLKEGKQDQVKRFRERLAELAPPDGVTGD